MCTEGSCAVRPVMPIALTHALVLGSDRRIQRTASTGDEIEVLRVADGVHLDQVEVVGLEPLQASSKVRRPVWVTRNIRS